MNIINAKQVIKPSWNGWEFYENSYCLDADCFFLTGHNGDGHSGTKPFHYKDGIYTPVLHEWCDDNELGLEDLSVCLANDGWWYLSAESKPYDENTGNINIETFKSKDLKSGWVNCPELRIEPTDKWFENYSMSSPKNYYLGNSKVLQIYETRNNDWWIIENGIKKYVARNSYLIFDTTTDKITYRHTEPIDDIITVADDLIKKDSKWYLSVHQYDSTIDREWYATVYKSNNYGEGYTFVYQPMYNDQSIGEIYFTDTNKVYFWLSNDDGMYEGYLEENEENMKPIAGIENNQLKCNDTTSEKIWWDYRISETGAVQGLNFGNPLDIPSGKQKDGYQFRCYGINGSTKVTELSGWVTYGNIEEPNPEPSDNDAIVANMRDRLDILEASVVAEVHTLHAFLDDIK